MVNYPTCDDHRQQWEELAEEIAKAPQPTECPEPSKPGEQRGSLTVLGSGIQGLGFTVDAEAKIRNADRVFYCVSNPPTQVWLRTLRPDAYDLYVFYDDTKPRYHTYIQMSEAILHPVRQGKNVVAIFYGHPGIFVLSTHRSIEIARREGHYAVMKPGVSALDCLCADLGVDPSYPGMQTFEATEALLRRRALDTSLHVILWQVGLIGEVGYRRKGFINDNFPVLVEYLNEHYGADHEVTHYVAARFPSFDPTIVVHRIEDLADPLIRPSFTGISTFYIPPKEAAITDIDMAIRLGLAQPGQKATSRTKLRKTALYSDRELDAIAGFESFRVPDAYQFQERTRAAELFIEMATNPELEQIYRVNPEAALTEQSFPGLSTTEKSLLVVRDENFVQVAAKGSRVKMSPNEKFVKSLYTVMQFAGVFRAELIQVYQGEKTREELNEWVVAQSAGADIDNFTEANKRFNASSLLPWTGVYATANSSFILTVIANPTENIYSTVYVNKVPIKKFAFNNSTLAWRVEDGNPNSARLKFIMPEELSDGPFVRLIQGKVWASELDESTSVSLTAPEIRLTPRPMICWFGRYLTELSSDNGATWSVGEMLKVMPLPGRAYPAPAQLLVGNDEVTAAFDGDRVAWEGSHITYQADEEGVAYNLQGCLASNKSKSKLLRATRDRSWDEVFWGKYIVWHNSGGTWMRNKVLELDNSGVRIDDVQINNATFANDTLSWSSSDSKVSNGSLYFLVDPITGLPRFIGSSWQGETQPTSPNIFGISEPRAVNSSAVPVNESTVLSSKIWETLSVVGSDIENPSTCFLWTRACRTQIVSRFVNRLVLAIIEQLK